MPSLIFINRYFYPDHSASSQILTDLAFHLAEGGRKVQIITSRQIYNDAKATLPSFEIVNNVCIHRVASTQFGRAGLLGRSIDYVSFYRSVWHCLLGATLQNDILIAKTDPPLVSLIALGAARRKGAVLINWLQDIYPEVAMQLGVPLIRGPVAAGLTKLRNRSLCFAEANVVVGHLMRAKVEALRVPSKRIHVIENWCNDLEIYPVQQPENSLGRAWGLQGKFVVGYSGNLGRAHDVETVLNAAELLRGNPGIVFLMIGGGKRFDELITAVRDRALTRLFCFMPYQEQGMLAASLGVSDVHWLSLNPRLEGLIVPSKFYGIAAAGKPIIIIADEEGELSRLVQQHHCGVVIKPGDARALVGVLLNLMNEPRVTRDMGMRARRMLDAYYTRERALERWSGLLDKLAGIGRKEREQELAGL